MAAAMMSAGGGRVEEVASIKASLGCALGDETAVAGGALDITNGVSCSGSSGCCGGDDGLL